jgi:flagellar biosynthesis GTPase FlhF
MSMMSNSNRFRGRTPGEAMKRAKAALGDEARLVSARRVSPSDAPPLYEVHVTDAAPEPQLATLVTLQREVEALRASVSALHGPGASGVASPEEVRGEWHETLVRRGVSDALARELAAETVAAPERDAIDAIRRAVRSRFVRAADDELGETSTIVLGPTGVGKTTVLSRIATERAAAGANPILISADGESMHGADTLQRIAEALGLRFETAFLSDQAEALVERFGGRETLLIDTPGRSPMDAGAVREWSSLHEALPNAELLGVLAVGTDLDEVRALGRGLASVGVQRFVLTKLDETARPGRVLEAASVLEGVVASVAFGRGLRGTTGTIDDPRVITRIVGTRRQLERSA